MPSLDRLPRGAHPCGCASPTHTPKLVVVTGGPGAGKTAVLEMMKQCLCEHVVVLPEAATIVFGGGFPRLTGDEGRRSAQRAICRVQQELERMALLAPSPCLVLCDRGTLDGLAYWPDGHAGFYADLGISRSSELARYHAVVHMHTAPAARYETTNPLRVESARDAMAVDARIEAAWSGHPRRAFVESLVRFDDKLMLASAVIRNELPGCCRGTVPARADAGAQSLRLDADVARRID